MNLRSQPNPLPADRGSVLIIVLWIAFGLVALALYFAHTMGFELRAADNRVASREAALAIAGAARYASNLLATAEQPGVLPDFMDYEAEAVPIGDASFWFLGREMPVTLPDRPWFALSDEAGKLNLNTATLEMLERLPRMTPELAAAIIDWRDTDSDVTVGGAEDETYQRRTPAYRCKNGPFESVDELNLVYGMTPEILYGEDTNLNGILDPNENDGDISPPDDNRDGRLDPGLLEYVTVYTREPNTQSDGSARVSVSGASNQALASLLQEQFGVDRANEILARLGTGTSGGTGGTGGTSGSTGGTGGTTRPGGAGGSAQQPQPGGSQPSGGTGGQSGTATATIGSVLEFYLRSGMTADEFSQIEPQLTVSTNSVTEGLVNINTASEAVLACIPGIGVEKAAAVVSRRQSNNTATPSVAWLAEVLDETSAIEAGPYITAWSYQCTADIVALGHHGRGYQRVRYVFDTSGGSPRIVSRQDLTHLGWALGAQVRDLLVTAKEQGMPPLRGVGNDRRRQ